MSKLTIDYDKQYDILYARLPFSGHSYGEELDSGEVIFRSIATDSVTGIAIHSFKKRFECGALDLHSLPIPLDSHSSEIKTAIIC